MADETPVFQIQRMYLKDLSLEQPNSPAILLEQEQPTVDIQLGVQNLLNTNNYGTYLATPGAGTPVVAGSVDANGNEIQTSFVASRISAPPRIVRLSVRFHLNR